MAEDVVIPRLQLGNGLCKMLNVIAGLSNTDTLGWQFMPATNPKRLYSTTWE